MKIEEIQQDLKFVAKRKASPAFKQIWESFKTHKMKSHDHGRGSKAWKRREKQIEAKKGVS